MTDKESVNKRVSDDAMEMLRLTLTVAVVYTTSLAAIGQVGGGYRPEADTLASAIAAEPGTNLGLLTAGGAAILTAAVYFYAQLRMIESRREVQFMGTVLGACAWMCITSIFSLGAAVLAVMGYPKFDQLAIVWGIPIGIGLFFIVVFYVAVRATATTQTMEETTNE